MLGNPWLVVGYVVMGVVWTIHETKKPLRRRFMYTRLGIAAALVLWPLVTLLSLYERATLWWMRGRYVVKGKSGDLRWFRWKTEARCYAVQNAAGEVPAEIMDFFTGRPLRLETAPQGAVLGQAMVEGYGQYVAAATEAGQIVRPFPEWLEVRARAMRADSLEAARDIELSALGLRYDPVTGKIVRA